MTRHTMVIQKGLEAEQYNAWRFPLRLMCAIEHMRRKRQRILRQYRKLDGNALPQSFTDSDMAMLIYDVVERAAIAATLLRTLKDNRADVCGIGAIVRHLLPDNPERSELVAMLEWVSAGGQPPVAATLIMKIRDKYVYHYDDAMVESILSHWKEGRWLDVPLASQANDSGEDSRFDIVWRAVSSLFIINGTKVEDAAQKLTEVEDASDRAQELGVAVVSALMGERGSEIRYEPESLRSTE